MRFRIAVPGEGHGCCLDVVNLQSLWTVESNNPMSTMIEIADWLDTILKLK